MKISTPQDLLAGGYEKKIKHTQLSWVNPEIVGVNKIPKKMTQSPLKKLAPARVSALYGLAYPNADTQYPCQSGLQKDADLVVGDDFTDHLPYVFFHIREVIRIQAPFKKVGRKHGQQALQLRDAACGGRIVSGPAFQVFFRPEEKHGASGIGDIRLPFGHRNGNMADQSFGIGFFDDAVTHLYGDGLTAVKARGLDAYLFPGEQPADRQRFERSLGKPFLFALDAHPELGGLVVERGKRRDEVCPGKQPPVDAGFEKRVHGLSPLFRCDPQTGRYLRVVGRPARCHELLHDKMKRLFQHCGVAHVASFHYTGCHWM